MDFTGFVYFAGKLKNTLGSGCLSRINVGEDSNISIVR